MQTQTDTELLTPAEAAKLIRRSKSTIRQAARTGYLKAIATGPAHYRHYEFTHADLMDWHTNARHGRGGARPHPAKVKESAAPNLGVARALKAESKVKWRPECDMYCPGCEPIDHAGNHHCWRYLIPRLAPADKDGDCVFWGVPREGKPRKAFEE